MARIEPLKYLISADFGQAADFTALTVIERVLEPIGEPYNDTYRPTGFDVDPTPRPCARQDVSTRYHLKLLERPPLRTKYTVIADRIKTLIERLYEEHSNHPDYRGGKVVIGLAFDATGVGQGVKDILAERLGEMEQIWQRLLVLPVTVTGGERTSKSGGFYRVPKQDLIGAGVVAFQNQQLLIPASLKLRDVLIDELLNYRRVTNIATGHNAFEPWREREHDDVLFATCLGCWAFERVIMKVEYINLYGQIVADAPVIAYKTPS
jgi:hypothetical protein